MWAGLERCCGQGGQSGDSCGRLAGDSDSNMRVGTDWSNYGGKEFTPFGASVGSQEEESSREVRGLNLGAWEGEDRNWQRRGGWEGPASESGWGGGSCV